MNCQQGDEGVISKNWSERSTPGVLDGVKDLMSI